MTLPSLAHYASETLTVLVLLVKVIFGIQIFIFLGLAAKPVSANKPSYYSSGKTLFFL